MKPELEQPTEGKEYQIEGNTIVFHTDKPKQWSCQVCKYWHVPDCDPMLEACGLPDCFKNKGYYTDKVL